MACPNRNRKRPRTVAFRLTDEEFLRLDQRVKITGEVKGDYLRTMALEGGLILVLVSIRVISWRWSLRS